MQWLIDIIAQRVIETIGIPPVYIDRGDPSSYDYTQADLITNGQWYDLNLSGIVPANAKAVVLKVVVKDESVGIGISLRKNSNTRTCNAPSVTTQAANIYNVSSLIVACDENRVIEYLAANTTWDTINILVAGWLF